MLKVKLEIDAEFIQSPNLNRALESARECTDGERRAIIKTNKAELMIWWDRWNKTAKVLEEAVPLSYKSGRMDLLARCLAWEAFVYQHKSQDENDRDKKGELLDTALKRAGQSLNALLGSATGEFFLDLCRTYLLLAGLHRCRQDACDDAENSEEFKKYLSKARALLDERKPVRLGEGRGLEVVPGACPNACYEEACYRVLLEDLDTSGADLVNDLLYAAIRVQPGWYNRAGTDFRLEPFREDERQWKILGERLREPHIIGGKEEQT